MTDHSLTWAIVFNPSKFTDPDAIKAEFEQTISEAGFSSPHWYETSVDDPGAGPAGRALDDGAELVCAMGGDGTMRKVASSLVGSRASLGLIPAGTGNLLARNLGLPVNDLHECLTIALTGVDHEVDLGLARFGDDDADEPFLVAAGIGLDAAVMNDTDDRLKKSIGRVAYLVGGAKALARRGFATRVTIDGRPRTRQHARTVMVCNSPSIGGGVVVAADGSLDDGELDVVVVSPRGIFGWAGVIADLVTRHRKGHARVQQWSGRKVEVGVDSPTLCQVDGDPLGEVSQFSARIEASALRVRVARPAEESYPTEEIIEEQLDD